MVLCVVWRPLRSPPSLRGFRRPPAPGDPDDPVRGVAEALARAAEEAPPVRNPLCPLVAQPGWGSAFLSETPAHEAVPPARGPAFRLSLESFPRIRAPFSGRSSPSTLFGEPGRQLTPARSAPGPWSTAGRSRGPWPASCATVVVSLSLHPLHAPIGVEVIAAVVGEVLFVFTVQGAHTVDLPVALRVRGLGAITRVGNLRTVR